MSEIKLRDDVYFKKVNDEKILVIDLESNDDEMFEITGVAMKVFEGIEAGEKIESISDKIKSDFPDVDPAQIDKDITNFVDDLKKFNVTA